jgi:hypothetical protein
MRVLVASLGFSYHHVMASANRCRPNRIILVTVNPDNERTRNAIAEVELYARVVNAGVEVRVLDPEDFWHCVANAVELFAGGHEYYLDVGGGVRALGLCLYTAAVLAVAHLNANLVAVYTMAEHADKVVEADLRPALYARMLLDARARARRGLLRGLASAAISAGEASKRVMREFEQYGLVRDGRPTSAARALARMVELRGALPP